MRITILLVIIIVGLVMAITFHYPAIAAITGTCSNCHTMHNSQNGTSMNFDNSSVPNPVLLRADCLGCHAIGLTTNIDPATGAPQVYHTAVIDLAGGNFAYMTGAKSPVTSDQNSAGHNIKDFGVSDGVLDGAPGLYPVGGHPFIINDTNLTCSGYIGCHGIRSDGGSGLSKIRGSHHQNVDGKCDDPVTVAKSYRFLYAVKGLEDSDWQATKSDSDHNEYFGASIPMIVSCTNICHPGDGYGARPLNNSISGFCATCHGDFHRIEGIGGDTSSPFKRHPTDVVLPDRGEYSAYTAYSIEAPVARTVVPDTPSATVAPGTTDVVMCLSCHAVHATPYADILRWDYSDMIAGDSSKSGGCFTCHTTKNQTP